MALLELRTFALLIAAYLAYRLIWAYLGRTILTTLYPNHYKVWSGTQPAPNSTALQQLRIISGLV